uniref:Fungal lipase-type domain-containing protein n=1 Tax=Lotharella globosa TaxID=91324 RepID=A0A7S3YY60_9EUKA
MFCFAYIYLWQSLLITAEVASALIILTGIIDFCRSKKALAQANYYETRFKQIVFRFSTFVLSLVMIIRYIVSTVFFAGVVGDWRDQEWNVALLLMTPMFLAVAWIDMLIAFLPPKRENKLLAYTLIEENPFEIPWGDVSLASVASHDVYYDHPDDIPSDSGGGALNWTRKGFRVLGWVRNDDTDAHCLIAEITPATETLAEHKGWNLRAGDLIVAFRGTGSLSNAVTDLTFCRTSLPREIIAKGVRGDTVGGKNRNECGGNEVGGLSSVDAKRSVQTLGGKGSIEVLIDKGQEPIQKGIPQAAGDEAWTKTNTKEEKEVKTEVQHMAANEEGIKADNNKAKVQCEGDIGGDGNKKAEPPSSKPQKSDVNAREEVGTGAKVLHWITAGTVHSGFLSHYMSIRDLLLETMDHLLTPKGSDAALTDEKYKSDVPLCRQLKEPLYFRPNSSEHQGRKPVIFVTGHSLGGAVSTLGALDFKTRYEPECQFICSQDGLHLLHTSLILNFRFM